MTQEELDKLKVEVFEFVYFKLVHKITRANQEEILKEKIASLTDDEKAEVSSFVEESMREFAMSKSPATK